MNFPRIFKGTFVKPSVWTMVTVVLIWTIAFFFANLFQCQPLWINWTDFGSTVENCIDTEVMYLSQAWSDVLTDCKVFFLAFLIRSSDYLAVIILTLPLPCVGSLSSLALISADLSLDMGNATACKAQDCCERHVSPWRAVSCQT